MADARDRLRVPRKPRDRADRPGDEEEAVAVAALLEQLDGFALDVKRELVVQIPFDPAGSDQRAKTEL